jgi:fructose-bisphosphate aldolase class II/tagatose 1,6-diphosphate aldolase GatY/KbaY
LKLTEKLKQVQKENKALLAANFYNFETCRGVLRAAAVLKQPIILQLTPASIKYMGLKTAVSIARTVSKEENALSWLHLDHCNDLRLIKLCLDEGFDSVMIDASDKTIEENIFITRQVVKMADEFNVNVEAELGYVPKPNREIENDRFTEPADAKKFVEETGISSLAIAIGTKHGFYKGKPKLEIDRLKKIRKVTDAYLVLHGGSGIPMAILREAICNGITKVNVATDTKDLFMRTLKDVMKNSDDIDLRNVFPLAIKEIQKMIEQKIKIVSMIN